MANESIISTHLVFSNSLCRVVTEALGQVSKTAWQIAESPDVSIQDAGRGEIVLLFAGSLQGEVTVAFDRAGMAALSKGEGEESADGAGTLQIEDMLRGVEMGMDALSASIATEYGACSVTIRVSTETDVRPAPGSIVRYTAVDEQERRVPVLLGFSTSIMDALNSYRAADGILTVEKNGVTAKKSAADPVNLDLVLDVELNVTLRFGQRILSLREVLDLTSGSVIELDRQVEEPVELLLEGKVIARGEAVVIDGNYGLRVTEVPQPISSQMLA
ncbi:MAG TPA: FliM/FliN family flagellar motor switch protein [Acidobacteriaceae bacterium]